MLHHVYSKTERKITFEQFQDALKLLAEKKFPGDPNGMKKITSKLTGGSSGPVISGGTVSRQLHILSKSQ